MSNQASSSKHIIAFRTIRRVATTIALLSLVLVAIVFAKNPHRIPTTSTSPPFPQCIDANNPIIVFPIYHHGGDSPGGVFGVAGCAYPWGSQVLVYFTDGQGNPVPGLPSQASPTMVMSRTTDGHFHQSFQTPALNSATSNTLRIWAANGAFTSTYPFAWVRAYCTDICPEEAVGAVRYIYTGWNPAGSPPGSFTVFIDTLIPYAHVSVYFVNRQTGASVPGLPSRDTPWTHQVGTITNFDHSFILPNSDSLDLTQYNVDATMNIQEDSSTTFWSIWFHRYVPNGTMT